MEKLIEAIRGALRADADPPARRAGLAACREILATLETATASDLTATPDASPSISPQPPPATPPPATPPAASPAPAVPPVDPAGIATLVASLGKLPPEQLLDLIIARLRAALPPNTSVPAPTPLRFQLVPLHHLERSK